MNESLDPAQPDETTVQDGDDSVHEPGDGEEVIAEPGAGLGEEVEEEDEEG